NSTTKIFLLNVIENYQSVTEPSTNIKSDQKENFNFKTSRSQSKTIVNLDQDEESLSPSPQQTSQVETPKTCSNKIQTIKSIISITKLQNEFYYAVVFWISDSKFSLVSLCQIHTERDQINQVGQNYDTSFGYSKHLACVKIIVVLSEEFPQILVSRTDKIKIDNEIHKCGEKQGSLTFRKVILILVPNRKEWVSRTMTELMIDFSDQFNVTFELVKVKDRTFDLGLAKGRINQIIQDSKKKISENGIM
ncbi:hypothetical protein BpHYR1_031882, partial [Brachionus plicatilis]